MKDKLLIWAEKFQSNIYIKTLSSAMTGLMPLMMISSIVSLVGNINFLGIQEMLVSSGIKNLLNQVNNMTLNVISLYVAFLIGYRLAELMGKEDKLNAGIIGLMSFLILTPISAPVLETGSTFSGIAMSAFGSQGMFSAMIAGVIGARLYILFVDKKLVIKLPDSVPSIVSKGFSAIIPGFLVATIFGILYLIMLKTPFGDFSNMVLYLVQTPLNALGNNILAGLILVAFAELLWFFGIHGSMAIMAIVMVLYYQPHLANLEAFNAGTPLPYLLTYGFIFGNRGARSFAVSLWCIFQAKSEQLKAVGKIGFIPALFGISEPIKFGIPQVMNVRMLIPLMLTPVVSLFSAYLLAIVGFLPYSNGVSLPLGSPIIVSAFFTNGWQGIVAQIIQLILCYLVYIPFMSAQDKSCLSEEAVTEQSELENVAA